MQITNQKHTLFISDLHLEESAPHITTKFLYFLENFAPQSQGLYILGDFFEVWVGDDEQTPFQKMIMQKLNQLTQTGVPVFFMHGNRDFLIGKKFEQQTGITIIKDPSLLNIYGKDLLLMHGDSLCWEDKAHQRFRKLTQNRFTQKLFLSLPISLRKKIGLALRKESKKRTRQLQSYIMDVSPKAVEKAFHHFNPVLLIHGHTHQPAIHKISAQQTRIVLGAWHDQGHMLVLQEDGDVSLVEI